MNGREFADSVQRRGREVMEAELAAQRIDIRSDGKFAVRNERTPSCNFVPNTQMWTDHGEGEGGNCFHLIAETRNLDIRKDFPKILAIAAAHIGLSVPAKKSGKPGKDEPPPELLPEMDEGELESYYGLPWSVFKDAGCRIANRYYVEMGAEVPSIVYPITLPDGKKSEKWRSLARRADTRKRLIAGVKNEYSKGTFGDPRQCTGRTLVLVGGEEKRLAAMKAGFFSISHPCGEKPLTNVEMAKWIVSGSPSEVVVVYDADSAGRKATTKACAMLDSLGVPVRYVEWGFDIPNKFDFNDLLREGGEKAIQSVVNGATRYSASAALDANVEFTDEGRGIRFANANRGTLLWHVENEQWMQYTGTHWTPEGAELEAQRRAVECAKAMFTEAAKADRDRAAALASFGAQSLAQKFVKITVEAARRQPGMSYSASQFDADHNLFNCANGTIDLRTGKLRPHSPKDLITKISRVRFDPAAKCPAFLQFMHQIMCGREDMVEFLQRSIGYAMTGRMDEQCMWIFYGGGSNGKSVFLRVIMDIMGDMQYAATISRSTIVPDDEGRGLAAASARPDLCALVGARFGWIDEPKRKGKMDAPTVKAATAGDPMQIRQLHGRCFTYYPTVKMFLATNHKPSIKDTDDGIWRRLRLVPFDAKFHDPENKPHPAGIPLADKTLPDKLASERSGILNWMLKGCALWQQDGLKTPKDVLQATKDFREASDPVGAFIAERCSTDKGDEETLAALYEGYVAYCKEIGEAPMHKTHFGARLEDRGFGERRTKSARFRTGIRLMASPQQQDFGDDAGFRRGDEDDQGTF